MLQDPQFLFQIKILVFVPWICKVCAHLCGKPPKYDNRYFYICTFFCFQELERAWREYDKLEYDVTITKNHMQEQLERTGEVQVRLECQLCSIAFSGLWVFMICSSLHGLGADYLKHHLFPVKYPQSREGRDVTGPFSYGGPPDGAFSVVASSLWK